MTATLKAGRYELLDEIGRGAMGVVYRAVDPVIGRTVAVKVLRLGEHTSGLSQQELLRRFHTEARAAGLLNHPHIVSVYDAGQEEDFLYITMELVPGKSLQETIGDRRAFPLARVLRLMQQACSALEFAHQHNVVHRDIKPANLILTADDTLKISDFGTAKILQFQSTQTGQIVGTPSYMSPEQIKGQPVDGRSDIFSIGAVLYELLTGRKPFPGDSVTAVIYKIVSEEPAPPRELDASIHPGLSAIVLRALAKSPAARFQSCCQLFDALQNYRDYQPPCLPRPAAPAALPSPGPSEPPLPMEASLAQPAAQGKANSAWLAVFLLAVIAAAGYKVWPPVHALWLRTEPVPVLARHFRALPPRRPEASSADAAARPSGNPARAASSAQQSAAAEPEPAAQLTQTAARPAQSEPAIQTASARSSLSETSSAPVSSGAVPPRPAPAKPAISAAAAEWNEHVKQLIESAGLSQRVRVTAAGSTLTLSGALDPRAHSTLLGLLHGSPAGVRIVDHIEEQIMPEVSH